MNRTCKQLLQVAMLLAATLSQAAEPRVAYSLAAYQPGTSTALPSQGTSPPQFIVKAGAEFDLAMIVQDKRPEVDGLKRGVFAAYVNLGYSSRYAALQSVQHTPPFVNGKRRVVTAAGLGPWGGMRGLGSGDTEPIEVSRIRFKALWPDNIAPGLNEAGTVFRISVAGLRSPHFDTLLYGNITAQPPDYGTVKPDEIAVRGVALRILK